jgi:hypothetical protein
VAKDFSQFPGWRRAYLAKNFPFWWLHRIDSLLFLVGASFIAALTSIEPFRAARIDYGLTAEGIFAISFVLTGLLSCYWLLGVSRTLKIKGAKMWSRSPSYSVLMIGLALINLPVFFMAHGVSGSDWLFSYGDARTTAWNGGAFFLWIMIAGYLGLFVCIGMRMGFAGVRIYYFGLLAAFVLILIVQNTFGGPAPSIQRLKFAGLYFWVFGAGGLVMTASFLCSLYKSLKWTKMWTIAFLVLTPLLGGSLAMLLAELNRSPASAVNRTYDNWTPLDGGAPLAFILLGFLSVILIGELGLAFARKVWSLPE